MSQPPENVTDAEFEIVSEPMVYAKTPYRASWLTKAFCYGIAALAMVGVIAEDTPEMRLGFLWVAAFWALLPWVRERLSRPIPAREVINLMAKMRTAARHRD